MKRYTKMVDKHWTISKEDITLENDHYAGLAIERLAKFESLYEDITKLQDTISLKLDGLRSEGKEKTVQFKELFGQKLINNTVLSVLKKHGLSNDE